MEKTVLFGNLGTYISSFENPLIFSQHDMGITDLLNFLKLIWFRIIIPSMKQKIIFHLNGLSQIPLILGPPPQGYLPHYEPISGGIDCF